MRIAIPFVLSQHLGMRHVISILLQNEAGALARVADLFSSRAYNIESLNVAPTSDEMVSRLTLVTHGSDDVIDQISKQLAKLVDVINIIDMTSGDHIEREIALFKLQIEESGLEDLEALARDFGAKILDTHEDHYTVELIGGSADVDRFMSSIGEKAEILTVVRSGAMAVARGAPVLNPTSSL